MKISILGAGNVSKLVTPKLYKHGHTIHQVCNRSIKKAKSIAKKVNAEAMDDLTKLDTKIDLLLIMVSDNAISEVAQKLSKRFSKSSCLLVHSSGSISSKELSAFKNYGVFYLLQTFKNFKASDWNDIPILYTANTSPNKKLLKSLASSLEMKSSLKSDKQRKSIHLSAVILNNFINHLFCLNEAWLTQNKSDFSLLIPLIQKTISNASEKNACKIQTGPAKRKDNEVIETHLRNLDKHPQLQNLYSVFSESIQKKYS